MCGKDKTCAINKWGSGGSPPHVRERPAFSASTYRASRDHPRMCGKDHGIEKKERKLLGSPPHVRERRSIGFRSAYIARITPACAGKTALGIGLCRLARDHPRMCGKDPSSEYSTSAATGSPPHVRERRAQCRLIACRQGITPACAGKTVTVSHSLAS